MSHRLLIINADDFGLSPGVTDGILECHRDGILTSTTLMTTMPDCDRAIELAQGAPDLGVGVHLVLTQGMPRSAGLRRLAEPGHAFRRSANGMLLKLALSARARLELEHEWSAQVEYALKKGVRITHLDSHKHLHHFPACHHAVIRVAQRFGIKHVRCARELALPEGPRLTLGYRALRRFAGRLAQRLEAAGLQTTDYFYGLGCTGRFDVDAWLAAVPEFPDGIGEVMVHPGDPKGLDEGQSRLVMQRQVEGDALRDRTVAYTVQAHHLKLTHYGKLPQ